jgi:hypothetical protein
MLKGGAVCTRDVSLFANGVQKQHQECGMWVLGFGLQ